MKVLDLYRQTKKALESLGIEEADAEARLIVADGLNIGLGDIFLQGGRETNFDPAEILAKRAVGMPLGYAMRKKYFMGFPFYVDQNVLIPRLDTEIIVDEALRLIQGYGYKTALDLCCGSGCIGIVMERLAGLRVLGSDISLEAVRIANQNAEALGTVRYRAIQSDLFEGIKETFELIVCNPPYITEGEYGNLDAQVRDWEPKGALVGGLAFYENIAPRARGFLRAGGALAFEIGCGQKSAVETILKKNYYKNIRCIKDLAGRDRVIVCTIS